ncbi:hypothetical protein ES703_39292 [subsurface metagenome]
METRDRRIIEILIGAVFIVLLFLVVFIVVGSSQSKTTITNSFNTYNIYSTAPQTQPTYAYSYTKPYIVDRGDYARVYYVPRDFRYAEPYDRYLRYYELGRLKESKGLIFGNEIHRYEVDVENREYVGGYFTVRFYFEDYYGRTKTESITYYIPAKEEKLFLFKDISPDKYKYRAWWYEVKSLTKAPTRVYYN